MFLKRRDKNHYVRSHSRRWDELPSDRIGRTLLKEMHIAGIRYLAVVQEKFQ